MTMQKIYRNLLIAVCAMLPLVSCVRDEEDLFEKSATVRLNEAMANAQKVLTSAPKGWALYYFPEADMIYGGYMYTMEFTDEQVTVRGDLFEDAYTSLYSMIPDNGPVLSFNTNNYAFHYFATPSGNQKNLYGESGRYQAYKGDYEFMVMKATPEEVVLKGKRTGTHLHMYPLQESAETYMAKVQETESLMFVSDFDGTINGKPLVMTLTLNTRQAKFTLPEEKDEEGKPVSVSGPFIFTDNGISLYEPLVLGGATINALIFDSSNYQMKSPDSSIILQGTLPENWHQFDDFLGEYSLIWSGGVIEGVEVKTYVKGKEYVISGFSEHFDIKATYDLSLGRLHLQAQEVGTTDDGELVKMRAWSSATDKVTLSGGGVYGVLDETGNTMTWVNNKLWSGQVCDSFDIAYYTPSGTRTAYGSAPWVWKNDSPDLLKIVSMERQ